MGWIAPAYAGGDWVHRYNDAGIAGLQSRKSPGRVPALDAAQRAELRQLVIDGPDPERDEVVRWRCADLRDEFARRFDVEVHESTIGKCPGVRRGRPDAPAAASLPSEEGRRGAGDF